MIRIAISRAAFAVGGNLQKEAWTMSAIDPKIAAKIASLREQVNAAQQEFDMAIAFHETWKPAAYDADLHKRMGTSFATGNIPYRALSAPAGDVARIDATLGQGFENG